MTLKSKAQSSSYRWQRNCLYLFSPLCEHRLPFVVFKCSCPTFQHPGSFQPPWHVSPPCFKGLNAKWWSDKTLSIKMCFMTTWDSWLVLGVWKHLRLWSQGLIERLNSEPDLTENKSRDSHSELKTFFLENGLYKTLFCSKASVPFAFPLNQC